MRHPEMQALFDAVRNSGPYESLDEVNRALPDLVRGYNARPQAALGGLSPDEMASLLYGDWVATGALRLTEGLSAAELGGASILADARTLLAYFRDEGPVKETVAGNLPRAVVASLLPRLRPPERFSGAPLAPVKVVNEDDVLWLPVIRHTLIIAGLLMRRRGFRITTRGRALLADERSGELYATLFRTMFRKLNLQVLDRRGGSAGLQPTIAFSLYRLRCCAAMWASPEAVTDAAWLETAKDPPSQYEVTRKTDFRPWTFRDRVLTPLVYFGLLEERRLPSEDWWREPVEVRVTPLFDRFLRFDLGANW